MDKTNTPTGVEDPRGIEVTAALVRLRNTLEDQRSPQRSAVRALIARARRRCAEDTRTDRRKRITR